MDNWTEIRTAYVLGKLGTVSATAEAIGVHRATIIRRVESLERQLGGKLFQRHTKGYTPTELGHELIKIAEQSDESFQQLLAKARMNDEDFAGEIVISCPEVVDHVVFSAARAFKSKHPKIVVHFQSSNEVLKLEQGEADVAIAIGNPPDHPDYVVLPLVNMSVGLYRSTLNNRCVNHINSGETDSYQGPFIVSERDIYGQTIARWIDNNIAAEQIALISSSIRGAHDAIISGLGAGFMPDYLAHRVGWLKEVTPSRPDWSVPLWVVTHVDLHRSAKVQSFLNFVRSAALFKKTPKPQLRPAFTDCRTQHNNGMRVEVRASASPNTI